MNVNVAYLIFFPLPGKKADYPFLSAPTVFKKDANLLL